MRPEEVRPTKFQQPIRNLVVRDSGGPLQKGQGEAEEEIPVVHAEVVDQHKKPGKNPPVEFVYEETPDGRTRFAYKGPESGAKTFIGGLVALSSQGVIGAARRLLSTPIQWARQLGSGHAEALISPEVEVTEELLEALGAHAEKADNSIFSFQSFGFRPTFEIVKKIALDFNRRIHDNTQYRLSCRGVLSRVLPDWLIESAQTQEQLFGLKDLPAKYIRDSVLQNSDFYLKLQRLGLTWSKFSQVFRTISFVNEPERAKGLQGYEPEIQQPLAALPAVENYLADSDLHEEVKKDIIRSVACLLCSPHTNSIAELVIASNLEKIDDKEFRDAFSKRIQ